MQNTSDAMLTFPPTSAILTPQLQYNIYLQTYWVINKKQTNKQKR